MVISEAHRHREMKGGGSITAVIIAKKNIGSVIRSVGNDQLTMRIPCVVESLQAV